jgi:tetratricopeptide (TPR) repeat protein
MRSILNESQQCRHSHTIMTLRINESSGVRYSPRFAPVSRPWLVQLRLVLGCTLFLLGLASPAISAAQISQAYFIRQEADEALLIRINAFEAEIEASVFASERRLLLSSVMPQSRLVPIFQFIDTNTKPRQLDIEVSSSLSTANSKFGIEVTRLSAWDKRSAALMQAYSLLSFGMQLSDVDNAANWTVKINSLMNAGATFRQYGMQELHLWSAYLAAHLVQIRLHDHNMVLSLTRDLLKDTQGSRWQEIELAALQLRSAALMGLRRSGKLRVSVSDPDPVQAALLKAAERADSMGYNFEKAQAIRQSALEYASRSLYPKALEQFQLAVEIADSIGADQLATDIRENVAQIHAGQGDDSATNKVLQEIETQLVAEGSGDELALNLLQQGRIFIRSYRYPQAIEVLLQALGFENDSSIRSQLNLELAKAYFETGRSTESQAYLKAAGPGRQREPAYFLQGDQAAVSRLSGLRYRTEALYQKARSLAGKGQRSKAIGVMENLIDEVLFLRQMLPGVLGAWYWARHEQLFAYYLGLQMVGSGQDDAAALESLLALSKMRYSESAGTAAPDTDALRALLAQAESVAGSKNPDGLNAAADRALKALRQSFNTGYGFLSKGAIRKFLQGLAADEALLTYHLTPSAAYVWLGRDGKVRQRRISNPQKLYADLEAAGKGYAIATGPGTQLLGPVADLLPETVYVIPSGPLLKFPMDALRVNDRYLAERHRIINLLSFPANQNPQASLQFEPPQRVFLAGHPVAYSGTFANRLETSAEIRAVTDIFMGPGLHIIQGAALLPDEFQGDRFANANLVHLSMPASIDLGEPGQSGLELSESVRGFGRVSFRQADIRALKLKSNLVFISASRTVGRPRSSLSTQAGVVSAFLDAGADAVIASLWTRVGKAGAGDDLVTDFYHSLEASGDIATALTAVKRRYVQKNSGQDSIDWARYQIFTN